ncbi:hypothetical protein EET67_15435 [Pseudaminobacter arsenicus]|uniref:Nucleotidyl transferase AbiEii/AbiGii toxin family protein n=1 Tax=Borborobacter arsenicus TaxID=1851146 RepID=A0A432V447_9HYPH|nr:nucleotidyl transferase AbiEii/AbiGii toxin family protein [Pseudaminobacter arsenicus]RUM96929.1 hypothetical protein EET67_15435 [Pseudaminobacter arsenicus]
MTFSRPEHQIIADLLGRTDGQFLLDSKCWFGGGTAIVLRLGEYRRSLDLDFLCSHAEGYRELRNAAVRMGSRAFFPREAVSARDPRIDQYGIRMFLIYRELPIKVEIVREARIDVEGEMDPALNIPTLIVPDMFAEKLLANADRCMDRSVGYRDAIDLGKLIQIYGGIPDSAVKKATHAYGADIERKLVWAINRLQNPEELRYAAEMLLMDRRAAAEAIEALRSECRGLWSESGPDE